MFCCCTTNLFVIEVAIGSTVLVIRDCNWNPRNFVVTKDLATIDSNFARVVAIVEGFSIDFSFLARAESSK